MTSEPTVADAEPVNLAAIEARAKAATPGPWQEFYGSRFDGKQRFYVGQVGPTVSVNDITGDGLPRADAEFIAHAREDVPALVAEVKRHVEYDDERDTVAGVSELVEQCRAHQRYAHMLIDWRYANTLRLEVECLRTETDRLREYADEMERQRNAYGEALTRAANGEPASEVAQDAMRRLLDDTYRPEGGEIVLRELRKAQRERDAAAAETERLRAKQGEVWRGAETVRQLEDARLKIAELADEIEIHKAAKAALRAEARQAREALQAIRDRARSEIADAKEGEHYHAEVNNGAGLAAEQSRRRAWEAVVRALDAALDGEQP